MSQNSKRMCITGIGIVSPLGCGIKYMWPRMMAGESGIISTNEIEKLRGKTKSQVIAVVPKGTGPGEFDPNHPMFSARTSKVNPKNLGLFIKYGLMATQEALEDAGLTDLSEDDLEQVGVCIGNGIGGLDIIEDKSAAVAQLAEADSFSVLKTYTPYLIPSVLPNLAPGNISMYYGFKGPNRSINAACASGLYAIEDGAALIRDDTCKIVVTGATESVVSIIGMGGFDAMTALSRKYNDSPSTASRPYDKNRDGFVLSEGAGILILEEMEHAIKRGAKIYAEYKGSGLTSDAYNVSAPSGIGSVKSMTIALQKAGLKPEDVDYIGVHATSTPVGDKIEIESIRKVFGEKIPTISAVKSSIGHMLGGASGVETVLLMKSMESGQIPPSINITDPEDFVKDIDYVPDTNRSQQIKVALKNSFGFGGANASSVFVKP